MVMVNELPIGPYRTLDLANGVHAPWYILPFDKRGMCEAPLTLDDLCATAQRGQYSDLYLFSHGWNNDWTVASTRYSHFLAGYQALRIQHNLAAPLGYKPLLVGVIWPSTALVLPWEVAPDFAAGGLSEEPEDEAVADERRAIRELAGDLPESTLRRFYTLSQRASGLDPEEAAEFVSLLAPLYRQGEEELGRREVPITPGELSTLWRNIAAQAPADRREDGDFGFAEDTAVLPDAAGDLRALDPRMLVRVATVWQMKNRAGTVGTSGVGPLLAQLQRVS